MNIDKNINYSLLKPSRALQIQSHHKQAMFSKCGTEKVSLGTGRWLSKVPAEQSVTGTEFRSLSPTEWRVYLQFQHCGGRDRRVPGACWTTILLVNLKFSESKIKEENIWGRHPISAPGFLMHTCKIVHTHTHTCTNIYIHTQNIMYHNSINNIIGKWYLNP